MLLYDQIIEHIHLKKIIGKESQYSITDQVLAMSIRSAQVYELSDCSALKSDWDREKDRAIPKRAPGPFVWAEWRSFDIDSIESGGDHTWQTNGFVIGEVSLAGMNFDRFSSLFPDVDYSQGGILYKCFGFKRIDRQESSSGKPVHKSLWNTLMADSSSYFFVTQNDGSDSKVACVPDVETSKYWDNKELLSRKLRDGTMGIKPILGLPAIPFIHYASTGVDPWCFPWVPFMAFALLHCKNVVTVDHPPDVRVKKHCVKQRLPQRATYKTLHMHLPRAVGADRRQYELSNDGPRVRQHICSGHFRELRSERFTKKQGEFIWVPQHLRGSDELGSVKTNRIVHG